MVLVAGEIMKHPLFSPEAYGARVAKSKGLSGMAAGAKMEIASHAMNHDLALLERACARQLFENVPSLKYEGPDSLNPLSFKAYDPDFKIDGKTLRDHLRLSVAYWHAFRGAGADPFGGGTVGRVWDGMHDPLMQGAVRMLGAFELMEKIGFPKYAFHDYDLIDGNGSLKELAEQLDFLTAIAKDQQAATGIGLAWNTNQLFALPIYMEGAGSAPYTAPFLRAVAQCHQSFKMAIELGAENFVFWGGREGYTDLINTLPKHEKDTLALFLKESIAMARKMGFNGQFLIEPKAYEPSMHQYDRDVATVLGFLKEYGLENDIKINFEPNHGDLAGLPAQHELAFAGAMLGSIDINSGRFGVGFDVDEFTNLDTAFQIMRTVKGLRDQGEFRTGVMNIDAKTRRTSTDWPGDMLHGFIKTADLLTVGLMMAMMEAKDGRVAQFVRGRYAGWQDGLGAEILAGSWAGNFAALASHVVQNESDLIKPIPSGRIEMVHNLLDQPTVIAPVVKLFRDSEG